MSVSRKPSRSRIESKICSLVQQFTAAQQGGTWIIFAIRAAVGSLAYHCRLSLAPPAFPSLDKLNDMRASAATITPLRVISVRETITPLQCRLAGSLVVRNTCTVQMSDFTRRGVIVSRTDITKSRRVPMLDRIPSSRQILPAAPFRKAGLQDRLPFFATRTSRYWSGKTYLYRTPVCAMNDSLTIFWMSIPQFFARNSASSLIRLISDVPASISFACRPKKLASAHHLIMMCIKLLSPAQKAVYD